MHPDDPLDPRELAVLTADLETVRPTPDPVFLAGLERRLQDGFPEADRARRAARAWRRLLLPAAGTALAAVVVALVVVLGGGSGRTDRSGSVASAPALAQDETAAPSSPGGAASSGAAVAPAPTPAPSTTTGQPRRVERSASLTLTPEPADVQQTADGVVRATQDAGGYVQRSQVATGDGGGTATFTLRVPSARLAEAVAALSRLAPVAATSQDATDITAATASAATLLADARAERQALLRALGRATTDRQIAALKARLADNRATIARRAAALDALRRRADLATVNVLVEGREGAAGGTHGGGWTPGDALHDAGTILQTAGGVALVGLAGLAPLAVLAALIALAARTARRRRREAALDEFRLDATRN